VKCGRKLENWIDEGRMWSIRELAEKGKVGRKEAKERGRRRKERRKGRGRGRRLACVLIILIYSMLHSFRICVSENGCVYQSTPSDL
jgi:hypothetical protein